MTVGYNKGNDVNRCWICEWKWHVRRLSYNPIFFPWAAEILDSHLRGNGIEKHSATLAEAVGGQNCLANISRLDAGEQEVRAFKQKGAAPSCFMLP